jgi:hypothetical protein
MTMPPVFAGDPAPQQLTAPCRKYSGRQHHPVEQGMYRHFSACFCESSSGGVHQNVTSITKLRAVLAKLQGAGEGEWL